MKNFDLPAVQEGPLPISGLQLVWVVLLSGAVFCYAHLPAFINPYVINDDVKQQIYWMQQWLDPALFRHDLLTEYARYYVPVGVKALYWMASWVMGPIVFSKVLPGFLFVLLGFCLFQIGAILGDKVLAWTTLGIYWLTPLFLDNLAGGLARGFAAPLLALLLLAWLDRRPGLIAFALLLQALFVPYMFLLGAAAVTLAWLGGRIGSFALPPFPARPADFLILAVGAVLVAGMNFNYLDAGFGPLVSAADMSHRPEFGPDGRYAILPVASLLWEFIRPWEFIAPFRHGSTLAGVTVCVVVVPLALIGMWRVDWRALKDRLRPFWWVGLASVLLYFLARIFLLKLFIPDRYVNYTISLFYCLALALCLKAVLKIGQWPRKLALLAVVLAALIGAGHLYGVGLKDYSAYQPLYAALAATPKDALIAGQPNLMDEISTFAQRRALVTYKLAHPWSKGYWQKIEPRLHDLFKAYYASDPQEVVAFCRKYGVSFMIVDDRHFTPDFLKGGFFLFPYVKRHLPGTNPGMAERNLCPFFAPFDQQIRRLTAGRQHFALLSDNTFHPQVIDQHLRLIDMRPWLAAVRP